LPFLSGQSSLGSSGTPGMSQTLTNVRNSAQHMSKGMIVVQMAEENRVDGLEVMGGTRPEFGRPVPG
jgi:hypothetical protein